MSGAIATGGAGGGGGFVTPPTVSVNGFTYVPKTRLDQVIEDRDRYRDSMPAGHWRAISVPVQASRLGFPDDPHVDDEHTAGDGSRWVFTGERWGLSVEAPDVAELLGEVATFESEVASLRSEVDRLTRENDELNVSRLEARKALADVQDVIGGPLAGETTAQAVQRVIDDRKRCRESYFALLEDIPEISAQVRDEARAEMDWLLAEARWQRDAARSELDEEFQARLESGANPRLPSPDVTNPAHLRYAADVIVAYWSFPGSPGTQRNVVAETLNEAADRLERDQARFDQNPHAAEAVREGREQEGQAVTITHDPHYCQSTEPDALIEQAARAVRAVEVDEHPSWVPWDRLSSDCRDIVRDRVRALYDAGFPRAGFPRAPEAGQ